VDRQHRASPLRGPSASRARRGDAVFRVVYLRRRSRAGAEPDPGPGLVRCLGHAADGDRRRARRSSARAQRGRGCEVRCVVPGRARSGGSLRDGVGRSARGVACAPGRGRRGWGSCWASRRASAIGPEAPLAHRRHVLGCSHCALRFYAALRRRDGHRQRGLLLHRLYGGGALPARLLRLATRSHRPQAHSPAGVGGLGCRLSLAQSGNDRSRHRHRGPAMWHRAWLRVSDPVRHGCYPNAGSEPGHGHGGVHGAIRCGRTRRGTVLRALDRALGLLCNVFYAWDGRVRDRHSG